MLLGVKNKKFKEIFKKTMTVEITTVHLDVDGHLFNFIFQWTKITIK